MFFYPVDLLPYYNNDGFAIMGNFSDMDNFDFNGYCYPADAPEVQMKWGKTTIEGVKFFMPIGPNGPNNIACSSQKIKLNLSKPVKYMLLVESASNGNWRERIKIYYRDGSFDDKEIVFTDWAVQPSQGEIPVFTFPFRYNVKEGIVHEILVSIFLRVVPLKEGKIPEKIVLPENPNVHIFAITFASDIPQQLKEKIAKGVSLEAPWDKLPWFDYKEPPVRAWTSYQTHTSYSPTVDAKADAVIVYDAYPSKVNTWRNRGAKIWAMYNSFWTSAALPIFKKHPEIIQTKRDGKPWVLIEGRYWVVPLEPWRNFVLDKLSDALSANVEAIFLEEPEFSWEAGYSEGFKEAWKNFYGDEWKPLYKDRDTAFRGGRLMAHLVDSFYRDIFSELKKRKPGIKTYVATHSIFHYITMFVTPFAGFLDNPYSDGIIGQVWTGTARLPFTLKGEFGEHIFHRAYLEYSFFASFKRGWPSKDVIFLTDPVEDNPNYTWEGYRKWYLQTLAACLLFPEVNEYEILPWPERVIARGVKYGGQEAPADYITQLFLIWDLQRKLHKYDDDVEYISGEPSFMAFISQTASYQKVGGYSFDFDSYLSMVGPLIDAGEGVYSYPAESVLHGGFPQDFEVALLDYSVFKPETPEFNEKLKEWIKNGGKLIVFGGYDEFCDLKSSWWKKGGFDSPTDHLMSLLGLDYERTTLMGKGEFVEVLNSVKMFGKNFHDLSNLGEYGVDLSPYADTGWVLVRITDATPKDGWGPTIKKITLEGKENTISFVPGTPAEMDYLKSFSPPGGVAPGGRYIDATGSVEYVFPVDSGSILKIVLGNDFKVEVKPFAAITPRNWGLFKKNPIRIYAPLSYYRLKTKPAGYRVLAYDTEGRPLIWKVKYGKGELYHVAFSPGVFSSKKGYDLALKLYSTVKKLSRNGYFYLRRGPYIIGYTTSNTLKLKGRYIDILDPEMPVVFNPVVEKDSPFIFAIPEKLEEGPFLGSGRIRILEISDKLYKFVLSGPPYRVNVVGVKLPSSDVPVSVSVKDFREEIPFEAVREGEFLKIFMPGRFNGAIVTIELGKPSPLPPLSDYRLTFRPKYLGYMKNFQIVTRPEMRAVLSIKEGSWFSKGGDYLYSDGGVATTGTYVYCDGTSYGVWRFPVAGCRKLMMVMHLANNFKVSFSRDGLRWSTGLDSMKLYGKDYHAQENDGYYFFDVSDFLPSDFIYVKLEDASPSDGWGAIMKSLSLVVPPMLERGELLLIGWKSSTPPPLVKFRGDYYRFFPLTKAFSYYDVLQGAKYYLKIYPKESGYVKVGSFNLPVYVVSSSVKLSQFVSSSFSQQKLEVENPSPLVNIIASSIALALTATEKDSMKSLVLDSVPQGYTLIAAFNALSDERFIVEDSSKRDGTFRYTDGKNKVIYRVKISPTVKDLVLAVKIGNDFAISASSDGRNWKGVVNSVKVFGKSCKDFKNYGWYYFKLPVKLPSREVYIKISDATPGDGWGAKFSEIKVYGRLP